MSAPPPRSSPRSSRPSFLRPSARAFALIVLLIAACVLGLAPILVRLTETGPAAAGFWRFLFALPLLDRPSTLTVTGRSPFLLTRTVR